MTELKAPAPYVRRLQWIGPEPGLTLALAAVWGALSYSTVIDLLTGALPHTICTSTGLCALALIALLFVIDSLSYGHGLPERWSKGLVLLSAIMALVTYWSLQKPVELALVVIVAAQIIKRFGRISAPLLVAGLDLLLLLPYFQVPILPLTLIAYIAFQIFTMLTMRYAITAREGHRNLMRINAELLSTRHLLDEGARLDERLRLSRELHDVMGHKLTAIKLQLRQVMGGNDVQTMAASCSGLADELLLELRGVVSALRRNESIDLNESLNALTRSVKYPVIDVRLEPQVLVPDMEHAHQLLRCAQEGVTNALRHSGASRIMIGMSQGDGGVMLDVEDDGRGLGTWRYGNGLTGMQERVRSIGGVLEFTSREGGGARLHIWLPQKQ